MKALWQKIVAPFQRISAWIQNRFRSPETTTPGKTPSEPAESVKNPNTDSTSAHSVQPVPPRTAEPPESNSLPAPIKSPDASSKLSLAPTQDSIPSSPATTTSADHAVVPKPSDEAQTVLDHPTAIEASPLPAPGTGDTEKGVLSPAQEALSIAQQEKALQIQQDHALALQLQESADGPQAMPVAPAANTTSPALLEELFGSDLTRIQFQQQGGNTCYLLAALNGIFHHPQGKRILESIPIQAIPNGYRVKFPGQPNPVDVFDHELGNLILADGETVKGVVSNPKGVQILECAYSKLDTHIEIHENERGFTEGFGEFFGVEHCLKALFGESNISLPAPDREDTLLSNALNTQRQRTDFADIWTGQEIHHVHANNKITPTLARHYQSVVPIKNPQNNALSHFQVQDPYHSEEKTMFNLESLDKHFQVSSVRILLPIASEST